MRPRHGTAGNPARNKQPNREGEMNKEMWIQEARGIAAQCWCDPETESKVMDPVLCEAVAQRIACWMDTAAQNQRNADYYRGLIVRCGEAIGNRAYIADDGSKSNDVLCAKVPELVEKAFSILRLAGTEEPKNNQTGMWGIMGERIFLSVPGKPIAKKRPRFARRGKYVTTYNDQETEEGRFLFEVQKQFKREPVTCAVKVNLKFFMPIPKSTSKKNYALMAVYQIDHTKKPDIDNLIKFALDCLNGVVYHDDSQIIKISGSKVYHPVGLTEIIVELRDFPEPKTAEPFSGIIGE